MEGALTNLFISSDIILNKQADLLNLQKKSSHSFLHCIYSQMKTQIAAKMGKWTWWLESDFEEK